MASPAMPSELAALPTRDDTPGAILADFVRLYGSALACDRCLLFLYQPARGLGTCSHGWWRDEAFAFDRALGEWKPQPADLAASDPLYAEAERNREAIYVEDIETAPASVLDRDYERLHFGHRALVHAPFYAGDTLIGILEPCVFARARAWSARDRAITAWAQEHMAPVAVAWLRQATTPGEGAG